MKKLNITKERFEKSNYFKRKYGELEYVSESGNLYKTDKGNVLMFKEGFMSNMGKDGQRLYSIVYSADGWDGAVQEYGKSEEDAIQAAIAKGKLDGDEDIVKIVDLGERREYLESPRKLANESIDADPALICPYCGGNNCEVSIGTDDLNFTNLDRLQGETFNVECWCNDCNKPYNVTVELNVKDVYPNEDADELSSDWE